MSEFDPVAEVVRVVTEAAEAGEIPVDPARIYLQRDLNTDAERLARLFHETYERLAPDFGYRTREASAKPWSEVPEANRNLMIATCAAILADRQQERDALMTLIESGSEQITRLRVALTSLRERVAGLGGLEYGAMDEGTRYLNADFVSRLAVLAEIDREVDIRAAVTKFLSAHYPNNGDPRASHLTWTISEEAFGDLRRALATDAVLVTPKALASAIEP